mmetsp:Transcript_103346/g.269828  ORF Transcript_103346/g.269828 Transcript_103346/m.269828 type:complete len:90 (-) Transcript_103346:200-469(-)
MSLMKVCVCIRVFLQTARFVCKMTTFLTAHSSQLVSLFSSILMPWGGPKKFGEKMLQTSNQSVGRAETSQALSSTQSSTLVLANAWASV